MIPRFLRRSVALGLVAAALGSGCSSTLRDAATIRYADADGNEHVVHVRRDDFEAELRKIADSGVVEDSPDGTIGSGDASNWLYNYVYIAAIDAEVAARALEVTDAHREQARTDIGELEIDDDFYEEIVERQARVVAVIEALGSESGGSEPTEADARAYYDANVDAITACPSARNLEQVLYRGEAEAQAGVDRLDDGASFEEVGAEAEGGTSSDCLDNNQFGAEFTAAANDAALGDVVGPVASEIGFHAIRVTEWNPTFEQFRDRIIDFLSQQTQQARQAELATRFDEMLTGWFERFRVSTDPRYGTWEETDNGWNVVPPAAPEPRDQRETRLESPPETTAPFGVEGG